MAGKTLNLPPAIANYVSVFVPRLGVNAKPGDEKKYSVVLTYPKAEAQKVLAPLRAAALAVADAKWPGKGAAIVKAMRWPVIADGDERLNGDGEPMFPGEFFVTAKRNESFGQPGVVDRKVQTILDPKEVYSGVTVIAQVNLYPYDNPLGGKGVGVGLNNLQVVKATPRRDGRIPAEEAFEE